MRVSRLLVLVVVLMVGCVGCANLRLAVIPTQPEFPDHIPMIKGARPMRPYPMWRRWWALSELCSGVVGDFNKIKWYYVPGWRFKTPLTRFGVDSLGRQVAWREFGYAVGMYTSDRNEIYLAESMIMDRGTIMHEMLHALGHTRHKASVFVRQCAVEDMQALAGETDPVFD